MVHEDSEQKVVVLQDAGPLVTSIDEETAQHDADHDVHYQTQVGHCLEINEKKYLFNTIVIYRFYKSYFTLASASGFASVFGSRHS